MRSRLLLVLLLLVTLPLPAPAGIIFGKKTPKPTPQERVPELLKIIKTDGDENKRAAAVEELRQYDPAQFPDIVPTLVDALLNDKKPSVRSEAAHSLGKLRPVVQVGGQALEMALANDSSMRVRMSARSALLSYQWNGYHSNGKKDDPLTATKEPPLADSQNKGPELSPPAVIPARMTPVPQPPLPAAPVPVPSPVQSEPKGPDLGME
jgi:HEAT repeats